MVPILPSNSILAFVVYACPLSLFFIGFVFTGIWAFASSTAFLAARIKGFALEVGMALGVEVP